MPYAVYAEGLYRALLQAKQLNIPIIVTETGAPDHTDKPGNVREIWIKRYLYSLKKFIQEGGNVKGFI